MSLPSDVYVPQVARDAMTNIVPLEQTPSRRMAYLVWASAVMIVSLLISSIVFAPLATTTNHPLLSLALYQAFSNLCHQMPERSFHLHGAPLAVCARCWGLYGGFALAFALYPLAGSLTRPVTPHRRWLLLAAVPTSVDFLLGFLGIWENTHLSRALTGALLGAVSALYVVPGVVSLGGGDWRSMLAIRKRRTSLASREPH